jgi:hypothetical protein
MTKSTSQIHHFVSYDEGLRLCKLGAIDTSLVLSVGHATVAGRTLVLSVGRAGRQDATDQICGLRRNELKVDTGTLTPG